MAMKSLSKLDEVILICSICLDTLKEPKILGCLHRYCKDCLASVIESNKESFKCPTCRQEFDTPDGGIEEIKGDFLIEAVLETRKLESNLREKQKEQICCSCDKLAIMVAICPDCGGFTCDDCYNSHKTMRALKSHLHLVTLEDIECGKVSFNAQSITSTHPKAPKCPVHKDMILHINCQTCERLICPVCASLHHNNHQLEEIASASERIKVRVGELVENSLKSENLLKEKMCEFRDISRAKLVEISGTYAQLKETANLEEQIIRKSEEDFLIWLEKKKMMVQEETKKKIRSLRNEELLLSKEIEMMESFCSQTLQKLEEQVEAETKIMSNSQMTAQILMKEVDNWSVVLSASDVQNNLQQTNRADAVKQVTDTTKSLTKLVVNLHDLWVSAMGSKCWEVDWTKELCKTDEQWFENGCTKIICDIKFFEEINKLILAGRIDNDIQLLAIEVENQTISWNYSYVWESSSSPMHIKVAGVQDESVYSTSFCRGFKHSRLTHDKGNSFKFSTLLQNEERAAVVTCVAQHKNNPTLIVGTKGSTVLHVLDFDGKGLSSIDVKVLDLSPPVSIATTEVSLLLCDGVSNASAVTFEGNLICKFSGRNLTDRPVVISGDRNGFVYVLWKIVKKKVSEFFYPEDKKENMGKKTAADNDANVKEMKVMQYTPAGTFVSEFVVDSDVTMMTTVVTGVGEDAVAVCTPGGLIRCFRMTSFNKTWSNFIQEQDVKSDVIQQQNIT